jgi:hypothetical protein
MPLVSALRLLPLWGWLGAAALAAPVAHYPFDFDLHDASGQGRHGTLVDIGTLGNSGVTNQSGQAVFGAGGLALSAERDYVAIPSRTFSSGTPYSLAFWARKAPGDTGDAAQWDMVMGQRDNTNFFVGLNDAAGGRLGLRWRSSDSSAARQADFVAPADLDWHHHVITASNTQEIRYYLDGTLVSVATNKFTGFIVDTLGEAYNTSRDFDFHGGLDEVWIFDHTLSDAEVANLHAHNHPAGPTALLLHYAFDGDLLDSSPSANHGQASGNAQTSPTDAPVGGGHLALDGQDNSYIALGQPLAFAAAESWSAAFWARRGGLGAGKGMVLGERFTTDDFIWLNDNFSGLRFRSSTAATLDFTAAQDLDWHHYTLVADGMGQLSLYVDGTHAQTLAGNTSFRADSVGQAYTTNLKYAFQGGLDEVRVYAGALSAAEVQALFAQGSEPPPPTVSRLRVFLIGGQSNADGRATTGDLPTTPVDFQSPQADIPYHYRTAGMGAPTTTTLRPGTSNTGGFGPEITFGHHLALRLGADATQRVALIKYAVGGTSLATDWFPGGDATTAGDGPRYVTFQQTVTSGLAALQAAFPGATLSLEGMIWMQGESDTGSAATAYADHLTAFLADLRATYGANLPFVVGRLSSGQTAVPAVSLAAVRSAQVQVAAADPWTGWVDTDDCPLLGDALHFNAAGQQLLGERFARGMHYQLWASAQGFSPAQLAAGDAEPEADADGDHAANAGEFAAGTDPVDGADVFVARGEGDAATPALLRWRSAPGRRYTVQAADHPAPGADWLDLGTVDAAAAPAPWTEFTDPRTTPPPPQYYRVRLVAP